MLIQNCNYYINSFMNYFLNLCKSAINLYKYDNFICGLQQIIIIPTKNIKFSDYEFNDIYNYTKSLNYKLIMIYCCDYITIKYNNNEINIYKYSNYYKININHNNFHNNFDVGFLSDVYDCINIFNILICKNLKLY